jgi:hypothetical protein
MEINNMKKKIGPKTSRDDIRLYHLEDVGVEGRIILKLITGK